MCATNIKTAYATRCIKVEVSASVRGLRATSFGNGQRGLKAPETVDLIRVWGKVMESFGEDYYFSVCNFVALVPVEALKSAK